MTPIRTKFLNARKIYSQCARSVERKIRSMPQLTMPLSERIVGLGIACDWVRRAAEMETISFIGDQLNDSPWTPAFVESTRYGFAWYGINAVFARNELLNLLGVPRHDSELERFRVLFTAATVTQATPALDTAVAAVRETALRQILLELTTPRLPGIPPGTAVTTLYALSEKYIPPNMRKKGAAKKVAEAAGSGNLTTLDLPTLLYVFRNWSVHGNAMHGSFGGRPKFLAYVELLLETLAEVHIGTASALLAVL